MRHTLYARRHRQGSEHEVIFLHEYKNNSIRHIPKIENVGEGTEKKRKQKSFRDTSTFFALTH